MLNIDDRTYSNHDIEQYHRQFDAMDLPRLSPKSSIAVCLQSTVSWLALCLYFKAKNISVMPIHPDTPLSAARRLADQAGCSHLYFQTLNAPIEIQNQPSLQSSDKTPIGLIQMSSGTTGEPKCITRSWQSIDQEIHSYISHFAQANTMTPVIACPTTHSYGLISGVLVALARGQSPIVITNINPKYLLKRLLACEQPLLYASPSLLQGLMRLWPKHSQLHAAMTSGTIMPQALYEQIRPTIKHLFQQYGCSEAGCISINQDMQCTSDIGAPLPHLSVSCSKDSEHPQEIVVTIPKIKLNDEPETTVFTQDLGYLQENRPDNDTLHFIARQDDTIIVAGLNVYPQQIEDILLCHPDIDDAVIFKIEDAFAGHRVCLHYVSHPSVSSDELRQWCQSHMASYQIPQQLLAVQAIERLPNGKVNRRKLAQQQTQKAMPVKKPLQDKTINKEQALRPVS